LRRRPSVAAFTLVELLVVIAIIGILVALLLPAIQAAREAARRATCQNNLHNLGIAVLNYESNNKILPEGMTFVDADGKGTPDLGGNVETMTKYGPNWIIKILPQMESQALYDGFERKAGGSGVAAWTPINDPGAGNRNVDARGTVITSLLCPSDGNNQQTYQGKAGSPHGPNWGRTNYAASAGRAFIRTGIAANPMYGPASKAWSGDLYPCYRGVMGPNAAVTLQQIIDGTSKTIMIAEIRTGLSEQDARGTWALGHAGASLVAMYGAGGDANGPNACYANSDDVYTDVVDTPGVCVVPNNPTTAAECMTASGGGLFDQATARSKHPGGIHIAMADASVQFITDDVETSGCYADCCSVWDQLILSADAGRGGPFGAGCPQQ
jgi:prepilin-type N-terminal cleavage/methylation domain-containing protein